MKNSELIAKLSEFDGDIEVCCSRVWPSEHIGIEYVGLYLVCPKDKDTSAPVYVDCKTEAPSSRKIISIVY